MQINHTNKPYLYSAVDVQRVDHAQQVHSDQSRFSNQTAPVAPILISSKCLHRRPMTVCTVPPSCDTFPTNSNGNCPIYWARWTLGSNWWPPFPDVNSMPIHSTNRPANWSTNPPRWSLYYFQVVECELSIILLISGGFSEISLASKSTQQSPTMILLDEWGTSGHVRPTVDHLFTLLMRLELYRAADFVAVQMLKGWWNL